MPAQLTVGSFDGDDNIAVCEKCLALGNGTITMEQLAPYYVTIEGESMALCPRHAKTLVLAYFDWKRLNFFDPRKERNF